MRKGKKSKRELIPRRVNISKRKKLTVYDYEGDAVVSKRTDIAKYTPKYVASLVERYNDTPRE